MTNEEFHVYTLKFPIIPLTRKKKKKTILELSTKGPVRRISHVRGCRVLTLLNSVHQINATIKVPKTIDYVSFTAKGSISGRLSF